MIPRVQRRKLLIPLAAVFVLAAAAAFVSATGVLRSTTLEFVVRDAVSKSWVFDATFRLQGRILRSNFQSDQGPVAQRFSHLTPGRATLEVEATDYQSVTRTIELHRGENRLRDPIDLVGLRIPDVRGFLVFAEREGGDTIFELRPVNQAGKAVVNHPCLDLWIGARVTVQMKNGVPARSETDEGLVRGDELFRDRLDWQYDTVPETVFRYRARLRGAATKDSSAPFRIVDFLIVVPNPLKTTKHELDEIMGRTLSLGPDQVEAYLAPFEAQEKLEAFTSTIWNVPGEST